MGPTENVVRPVDRTTGPGSGTAVAVAPTPTGRADQMPPVPVQRDRPQPAPVHARRAAGRSSHERDLAIGAHLPLVRRIASRFVGRGEPYDDLVQVGTVGLVHAVDRYDAARGPFAPFAAVTITGEIRRHLRDNASPVHVPRTVKDLHSPIVNALEHLGHTLQRTVTVTDVAAHLGVAPSQVRDATWASCATRTLSLDDAERDGTPHDAYGVEDFARAELRATLTPLLSRLPARQVQILYLRFAKDLPQQEIAGLLGISQMHVSRLLRSSLTSLREGLGQAPGTV